MTTPPVMTLPDASDFEVFAMLPDEQKRDLCIQLLEEFGAESWTETTKGELRHKCTLPLGGHSDHNSVTASINFKKLTFKCYVCQNAGGFLWWIAVNRRESTQEAKEWLTKTAGVGDVMDLPMLLRILEAYTQGNRHELTPIPTYDVRFLDNWTKWPVHHPYLTLPIEQGGRGIPDSTLDKYRVGYCDSDEDWRYYQRIIIPLFWQGNLVGWQARRLWPEDPDQAKYKNSPDFPRDRALYGDLDHREIVLVESPMSVLKHDHHLPMVASLGASLSDHQIPNLHRYRRITLFYDNDKAGFQALLGSKSEPGLFERLAPYTELRVVQNPYSNADPADLADAEMERLVNEAVPYVLWRQPSPDELVSYQQ